MYYPDNTKVLFPELLQGFHQGFSNVPHLDGHRSQNSDKEH